MNGSASEWACSCAKEHCCIFNSFFFSSFFLLHCLQDNKHKPPEQDSLSASLPEKISSKIIPLWVIFLCVPSYSCALMTQDLLLHYNLIHSRSSVTPTVTPFIIFFYPFICSGGGKSVCLCQTDSKIPSDFCRLRGFCLKGAINFNVRWKP